MDEMYLREATKEDCNILFEWVNDSVTRQNSFNSEVITYDKHCEWFNNSLKNCQRVQLILEKNNIALGQIRFDFDVNYLEAEVSYSIAPKYRLNGYGTKIIKLGVEYIQKNYPSVCMIKGKVKPGNIGSYRSFINNKFLETYRSLEFHISKEKQM